MKKKSKETEHARLSPSAADGWMVCADYANVNYGRPRKSSVYSAEGTVAHYILECCLLFGLEPVNFQGKTLSADGFSFYIDEEFTHYLTPVLDRVLSIGGELHAEHRVNLDKWMPGQFGTLDIGIIHPDFIYIGDLKYGAGEPVQAELNRQLMIYALGFWWNVARHKTKATKFIIEIHQPRATGGGGVFEIDLWELLAFGAEVEYRAAKTYGENLPRVASEKGCRWCEEADRCATLAEYNLALMCKTFDQLDEEEENDITYPMPNPRSITPEQRARILMHQKMFNVWFEKLHTAALEDAMAGRPTPHQKVVYGREGDREWGDDEIAEDLLREMLGRKAFKKKLVSPAQAEKLVSKTDWQSLQKLITRAEGKPVLVAASDRREAIQSVVAMFDEIPIEDEEFEDFSLDDL